MDKIEAALKSIAMTKWFILTSWSYITTKKLSSKVEFFTGLIPAWIRFTYYTYTDVYLSITNTKTK
jgi:hypothetical protein